MYCAKAIVDIITLATLFLLFRCDDAAYFALLWTACMATILHMLLIHTSHSEVHIFRLTYKGNDQILIGTTVLQWTYFSSRC